MILRREQINRPLIAFSVSLLTSAISLGAYSEGGDSTFRLEEIVVTAQRKAQSLQDAAVAIDAFSGGDLIKSGISNSGDLSKLVPAIRVVNGGGSNTSIYMRGVGNRTNSSYVDPAVAISYDGVFLGRPAGAFATPFYDVARVEVLKGPQGILYGRNATGGAINVIPETPKLDLYEYGMSTSIGNYSSVEFEGFVNIPVNENVAVRLSANHVERDGYNRDGTSDRRADSFRGQVYVEPSDELSIRVGLDYTNVGGAGDGFSYIGQYVPGPDGYDFVEAPTGTSEGLNTDAANAFRQSFLGAPGFGFLSPMNDAQRNDFDYWGINAEINWDTDLGKLTLIPAYRVSDGETSFYGPAFNTGFFDEKDTQYSLEARISNSIGAVDYIAGLYYFREKIDNRGQYNQEFVLPIQEYTQDTRSSAGFGQLTWNVTDQVRLIAGARYTNDNKEMNGLISNFISFCGGLPPSLITPPNSFAQGCADPTGLPRFPNIASSESVVEWLGREGWISESTVPTNTPQVFPLINGVGTVLKTYEPVQDQGSYSRVTWKLSAEYDVLEDSLLYATVETGYRAGGFQLAEGRYRYDPEFITAYTLGSKNRFLGDRLQLNLEAFYWSYEDQQISYFTADESGTLINSTENAGEVTIQGIDVDVLALLSDTVRSFLKVQYLSAKYDDIHLYTASPRDNFNCPFTLTDAFAGGEPVKDIDCSGRPAQYSPRWSVNMGIEHEYQTRGDWSLVTRLSTAWRDEQWGGFEYLDEFERIPSYWSTDFELELRSSRWSATVFARNIEDKREVSAPTLAPTGQAVAIYSPPRTVGLRIELNR